MGENSLSWPDAFAFVGMVAVFGVLLLAIILGPSIIAVWAASKGLVFQDGDDNETEESP